MLHSLQSVTLKILSRFDIRTKDISSAEIPRKTNRTNKKLKVQENLSSAKQLISSGVTQRV